MIIISKNPASQDKISLDDKFWSGTVIDFPDENNNLYISAVLFKMSYNKVCIVKIILGVKNHES